MANTADNETTRVLRPRLPPEVKAEKKREEQNFWSQTKQKEQERLESLPFIKYKGKLVYHTEWTDVAFTCDSLLERVNQDEITVIGFDIEWPFSFQTGSGKTAVIQISPDLKTCYILQVSKFKKLPKSLNDLLIHDKVTITGNNIKNDVRKLSRDFPGFDAEKMIQNCVDLGVLTNSFHSERQRWSLANLVQTFLNMRMDKNKKVRMSRWDQIPLSKAQLRYAAIDAYASLWLYQVLKEKEAEIRDVEDEDMEKEAF